MILSSQEERCFLLLLSTTLKESRKMVREEPKESPHGSNQSNPIESNQNAEGLFSPRFKSIAAMAGWDEEALIVATLVVEDTPDRVGKHKKRSDFLFKTPPSSNSRRKRRAHRRSPVSTSVAPLNLEEEDKPREESEKKELEQKIVVDEEKKKKKTGGDEMSEDAPGVSCSNPALPCLDKLREELSCAICLEICYEPSSTPCGHSFCKKCLRSSADKCGKRCPKCRQLISNGRSCTINTVLWNTIKLLFPQEVEARKAAGGQKSPPVRGTHVSNRRTRSSQPPVESGIDIRWRRRGAPGQDGEDAALAARLRREDDLSRLISRNSSSRRRRGTPSQDEDAALALRLQREEFMQSFRRNHEQSRAASLTLARENLRAMASRAINIRMRGRQLGNTQND